MRKQNYTVLLLIASAFSVVLGQVRENAADSLKRLLVQSRNDTTRVLLLEDLAGNYQFFKSDTAIILSRQAIILAQKARFVKGEIRARIGLGEVLRNRGEFPQALAEEFRALQLSRKTGDAEGEALSLAFVGPVYIDLGEYRQALHYLFQAEKNSEQLPKGIRAFRLSNIGTAYEKMNRLDSALYFQQQALDLTLDTSLAKEQNRLRVLAAQARILTNLGVIENRVGNIRKALDYYSHALQTASLAGDLLNKARSQYQIAEMYRNLNQPDSALWYARQAFEDAQKARQKAALLNASGLLSQLYKDRKNADSALLYEEISAAVRDSLFGPEKFRQLQLLTLSEQQRVQQLREQQARLQRTVLLSALGIFLLIALLLWRNIHHRQRAYALLQRQKEETEHQKLKAEETLTELRATQAQLIQREKMASLGELTAGIAHEIQNPLNFVNNFSEVGIEMLNEAKEEVRTDNAQEAMDLIDATKENLQKIVHHGRRADAIVKGMLQHSRVSTGKKEPTDINALVDEYLRLSYHGMRAKDKAFGARLQTAFDDGIRKVAVVPEDIGRVLLNLFNNAFYAVNEKKKQLNGTFEPLVTVSTKRANGGVQIIVWDNGSGIPQKNVDKIFQPFFTTKPTGEGTGLGLSLSYDIITKGHGGELKVETKEGEFALFIVQLPV
ncbi:MAG: tetratricopeptide repeat protein [Flavisolibacter sp.]|nr:tetratricopeptide repeat protein [Flavisolibacter sp.]